MYLFIYFFTVAAFNIISFFPGGSKGCYENKRKYSEIVYFCLLKSIANVVYHKNCQQLSVDK